MEREHRSRLRSLRAELLRAAAFLAFVSCVLLLATAPPRAAGAQSAERITLDEWGVTIEFGAADEKVASEVASICRKSLPLLARQLGLAKIEAFHVFLISDVKAYEERMGFTLPSWGIAFAFPENRVVLVDVPRATRAWDTLDKAIPHELSHLLLAERAGSVRFPLWFMEGLAQWQADEWSVVESWYLMEAVWSNRAPALGQVVAYMPADETRAHDAYRVAYAAFQYRFAEHTERLVDFLDEVVRRGDFAEAFAAFWNESEGQFCARFDEYLARKYGTPLMLFQTGPLFTLASVLFVLVFVRVWIRNRRKLRRMEETEKKWPPGPE